MLKDKDIREPLFDFFDEIYPVNRVIEEKNMGRSRADIVCITPTKVIGIEIKSDADTYTRLSRQVEDYDLYFDYNYVVVGSSHASHISEHVPDYWGIISVEKSESDGKMDFYIIRKPSNNPKLNWERKLSLLWRPELAHIQEINKMAAYKQKSKLFVIEKILEKIDLETLQMQLCVELMERDYNTIADKILEYRKANAPTGKKVRRKKKKYRKKI